MMMIFFFSWKSHRYTECMGFLEIWNEINHFVDDQEHSRKTPPFSPAFWPLACEIYLKNNIEISLRLKNELKIELKRLACGKYLVRYPNISTVCLVAVVVISLQCCLFSLSSSFKMLFCSWKIKTTTNFKCKWKMVRRMRQCFCKFTNAVKNKAFFDIHNEISVTKNSDAKHKRFICIWNIEILYTHTHTVSVRKESWTFRFFRTDSFDHTYLKQNETDSCFIWNWQRIVWDNGMQPN